MIEANKKYISATLKQGTAHIQQELIQLYVTNINAIGVQAALVAGLAFQAIYTIGSIISEPLEYWYYICYTICFITALFALTQATVTAIYGSSLAVKGKEAQTVESAAEIIKRKQDFILKIGFTCISSLFAGGILQAWSLFPDGIAIILTFLYFTFWVWMAYEAYQTIKECTPGMQEESNEDANKKIEELQTFIKDKAETGTVKFIAPNNIAGLKYIVLNAGKIYIYKDEKSYKFQENCVTKAINLRIYKIREERRISSSVTSGIYIILEPLIETEIEINPVFEFSAQDGKNWREDIKEICNKFEELTKEEGTVENQKNSKYKVAQVVKKAMSTKNDNEG